VKPFVKFGAIMSNFNQNILYVGHKRQVTLSVFCCESYGSAR